MDCSGVVVSHTDLQDQCLSHTDTSKSNKKRLNKALCLSQTGGIRSFTFSNEITRFFENKKLKTFLNIFSDIFTNYRPSRRNGFTIYASKCRVGITLRQRKISFGMTIKRQW